MPRTFGEIVAENLNDDPEFRAEWQRLTPAREFSAALLRYRAEHGLSQRKLGEILGVSQPRVAKLESGEHNPDFDTIIHAVRTIGIEFVFDAAPATRKPKLVNKRAQAAGAVEYENVSVVAAAAS
jgi:transcriptional regulator with XRE-family HTH domain